MNSYQLRLLRNVAVAFACMVLLAGPAVQAAPGYDQGPLELRWVLQRMIDWLPGEWSSAPQLDYEHTVRMPAEGEHDDWYRTFALIKAPQVGDVVFYGQINLGGPNGPLLPGSQVLYKTWIDEQRGVVVINGQGPSEPEKYVDLQRHPELWSSVKMRSADTIRCDFIWRRDGAQVYGVLDGKTDDMRKYGPGSCNYMSARTGAEFRADAEWVLSPQEFWLYDINLMGGRIFLGREDRTHTKLYRSQPYRCEVRDASGRRSVAAYNRGYVGTVKARDGGELQWRLLQSEYPSGDANGLVERLRLTLGKIDAQGRMQATQTRDAAPNAASVAINASAQAVAVRCAAGR